MIVCWCFILCRFDNKTSAAQAIVAVHGTELNGTIVKCSWGKESNDQTPGAPNGATTNGGGVPTGSASSPTAQVCHLGLTNYARF